MSTPDTFRDALARTLPNVLNTTNPAMGEAMQRDMADAVLASDEMQTLRLVARGSLTVHQLRLLHPSVRAWVLDDPSLDSPADKPCETCNNERLVWLTRKTIDDKWEECAPCPSCRGGEQ